MKIPLDILCVKTGVLCPRCQSIVRSGSVREYEVDVMRELLDLEELTDFKFLKDMEYVRSVMSEGALVIILQDTKNNTPDPRSLNKLSWTLSERLKIRTRIVTNTKDLKEVVKQLVFPARITSVNTIWLPDGTVEYVVRVPRFELRNLPFKRREIIEDLLTQITGNVVKIRAD
ncbi:MAG: transcription elongation factor NusA [Zestosphaera sp.]